MPTVKPLAALLLAAGLSRRFNGNKLACPVTIDRQSKPLLLHTLDNWLSAFAAVNLMLPADDNTLHSLVDNLPADQRVKITIVPVYKPESGISQSLKAGVLASQNAGGWLIGLADMPWVKASLLINLHNSIMNGAKITAPYFQGQRGQPVAFDSDYRSDLLATEGDQGAKKILRLNASKIVVVTSPDNGILRDIDTPADLD